MKSKETIEFPTSHYFTGYLSKVIADGEIKWALMDCEGEPVHIADQRSSVFFFAHEHDITVVRVH